MGQWTCEIGGKRQGPFGDDQLKAMAREGRLGPADRVWNPAGKRWELAGKLQGLFPALAAGVAAGAAGGAGTVARPEAALAAAAGALSAAAVQFAAADPGPFLKIAGNFGIESGSTWTGCVVASHSAFYLLKAGVHQGYGAAGVVGALAAAAFSSYDDYRSCRVDELPPHVRGALDPKNHYPQADVIVLPKNAVSRVQTKFLGSGVTIQCGGNVFNVVVGAFSLGKVKNFLQAGGWVLREEVQPSGAALHGRGFGRAGGADERDPAAPSPWGRAVYAVLAIGAFLLVAYLKFEMRRGRNGW